MITSTHTHSAGSHLLVLGQLHLHLLRNLGELLLAVTAPKEVLVIHLVALLAPGRLPR
jgi:hypothetical protein